MYLFKASMAFAMRQYYLEKKGEDVKFMSVSKHGYTKLHMHLEQIVWTVFNLSISFYLNVNRAESIYTYKETPRISFYFVVTDPNNSTRTIPKAEVEAAIW